MQQAVEMGGVTGHDAVSRTCKTRKKVVSTIQCELQATCVSMQYLSIRSEPFPPPPPMGGGNPPIMSDDP